MGICRIKLAYADAPSTFGHLYVPDESTRPAGGSPLVVLVHGGYWSDDYSLVIYTALARSLAERGAIVWNLEYRRLGEPGGGWPTTGRDVIAGIEAVESIVLPRLSADGIAVNESDISVVGHSAGGHLAVYAVGTLGGRIGRYAIGRVIAQSAVLDFVSDGASDRPWIVKLMGRPFDQIPDQYRAASPSELAVFPTPVIVIHTEDDASVPVEMSRHYVKSVCDRGQSAVLYVVPTGGHNAFLDPESAATRQTLRALGI